MKYFTIYTHSQPNKNHFQSQQIRRMLFTKINIKYTNEMMLFRIDHGERSELKTNIYIHTQEKEENNNNRITK